MGRQQQQQQQQEVVEEAGVCEPISEAEEKLGEKAQEIIGKLPVGKAAEILTRIVLPQRSENHIGT